VCFSPRSAQRILLIGGRKGRRLYEKGNRSCGLVHLSRYLLNLNNRGVDLDVDTMSDLKSERWSGGVRSGKARELAES